MKSRAHLGRVVLLAALGGVLAAPARADDATTPGAITTYTTFTSAGFEWAITGDANANCVVTLEYHRHGDSAWKPAQPLWRVETGLWHHGEDPGDLLAGSLFFLDPATTYDARLTLSDPDGGSAQRVVTFSTRAEPVPLSTGRLRYVVPGSGGGSGSQADPFRGLAAADAGAAPGDRFVVGPGTYTSPFVPLHDGTAGAPIAYLGAGPATVILDGGGHADSTTHCLDLTRRQYLIVQDLTLQNCLLPVIVSGTRGVSIHGCTIQPVHQLVGPVAILGDSVQDLDVADNTLLMTGDWTGIGRTGAYGTGGYGVELTGNGIVVRYNHVVEAWDGFDVGGGDGSGLRTFNADVYGNFVDRASDDACQTDAVHQNVRVFRNRFLNCGSAASCQPCFGGPCYILLNEMFNVRIDPFKYHQETFYYGASDPQETSGMIAFHNTVVGSKAGWYESGQWHHVLHRDNLLLGARANMYTLYVASGIRGDLDYDGLNRQQSTLVKYDGVGYATLPAFAAGAGEEAHGLEVTGLGEFVTASWPDHPEWDWQQGYGAATAASAIDLELSANSLAIDRGEALPGIDDGFTGAAPDLGCYERGLPLPWYGPRTAPASLAVAGPGAAWLTVSAPRPNPTRAGVELALVASRPTRVDAIVEDVAGRLVRRIASRMTVPTGSFTLAWDGTSETGALVAPGLYFVMARAGGVAITRRVAVVR